MYTSNGYELSADRDRLGDLEPVPAALRNDRAALRERLERDGYLFLRGALDRHVVLDFRRYYFDALAGTGVSGDERDEHGALGRTTDEPLDHAAFRHRLFRDIVPGGQYAAFCTPTGGPGLVRLVPRRRPVPAPAQDHPAPRTGRAWHRDGDPGPLRPALPARRQ